MTCVVTVRRCSWRPQVNDWYKRHDLVDAPSSAFIHFLPTAVSRIPCLLLAPLEDNCAGLVEEQCLCSFVVFIPRSVSLFLSNGIYAYSRLHRFVLLGTERNSFMRDEREEGHPGCVRRAWRGGGRIFITVRDMRISTPRSGWRRLIG